MVATVDKVFSGSIPELYERFLVPLIFESYALDLTGRLAKTNPRAVLETAAGTGVLTRAIASALPAQARMTVTDLNQTMQKAGSLPTAGSRGGRRTRWRCRSRMEVSTPWPASSARCFFPTRCRATSKRAAS